MIERDFSIDTSELVAEPAPMPELGRIALPHIWSKKGGSGSPRPTGEEQLADAKDKATGKGKHAEVKRPKGESRRPT